MFGVIDWNVSVMRHPVELEFNTDSVGEVREECMGLELAHPGSLNRLEMLPNLLGSFDIHRFVVRVGCGCRDCLISCLAVSNKFHGCCLFLWSQRACGIMELDFLV